MSDKHPGGRPSKYDPSFVDELDNYLETTGREQQSLPTIQGFAIHLRVDSDTLNNWSKDHPEFFGALKRLKELQAKQLIDDGIYGGNQVNATIVKLMLQNNHGMREKVDTDITSGGERILVNTINYGDNSAAKVPTAALPASITESN